MQKAGQIVFENIVQTEERNYVHNSLHKTSRDVVEWVSQFFDLVIVFEDLKDTRDDINYGTRMNVAYTPRYSFTQGCVGMNSLR
jgi:IS605 OrfB family transposase